jgi:DNA polymerase-3 subunit gamma/tau
MLIAELADGGMRDALSMCEQILSAQAERNDSEHVAKILGVVSHQAIKSICTALIEQKVEPALKIVKSVYESGLDLCQMTDAMSERFRVLSLCAHLDSFAQAAQIVPALSEADFNAAQTYEKGDLKRLFAMALNALGQVSSAPKPLFALELFILRAALRPPIADATTIAFHLQKLDAILHNRPMPIAPTVAVAEKKTLQFRAAQT